MVIVKLKIRESKQGFQVDLTVKQLDRENKQGVQVDLTAKQLEIETEGFLPLLPPQLESSFKNWQLAYRQIDDVRICVTPAPGEHHCIEPEPEMRLTPKSVTKYSSAEYASSIKQYLNEWLNCSDSRWFPVRDRLIAIAQKLHQRQEDIRIIIDAKDINLRRLPWQEWNLFQEYYPQVEIALAAGEKPSDVLPKSAKIRVLVAVGRSDGINTKDDLEIIQNLEQHGAEVVCLMQPNRKELCDALWDEKGYHIFIFTGHSGSREDGHIGWIELNDKDSLSIEEFKLSLKQSIHKGLQLAIFNSCDGLGLANQLAQLHLPRCIVMREPVPDRVAIEFLKHFFPEFTRNQSLSKALNRARKRLEHFNLDFPGATWLPTICIAPNVKPLTWKSLNPGDTPEPIDIGEDNPKIKLFVLLGLFISCIAVVSWNLLSKPGGNPIKTSPKELTFTKLTSVKVPSGEFSYGGSTTWEPLRQIIEPIIRQAHPNFKLIHKGAIASGTGIKRLLNDKLKNENKEYLDFGLSSRRLNQSERKSNSGNYKLQQEEIAIDGIAIAVNHELKIEGLTIEQLKNIYTGRITNWKQLGGEDLEIVVLSRKPETGGTPKLFVERILLQEEFGNNVQFLDETTTALGRVKKNRGAIYYASAPVIVSQCSVRTLPMGKRNNSFVSLETVKFSSQKNCEEEKKRGNKNQVKVQELIDNYPSDLTRTLYVIYKQTDFTNIEPDLRQKSMPTKAGEAYINLLKTDEGKKIIREAGFVPLH